MAVEYYGEVYLCNKCGNKVKVIEAGGGTLVCWGKEMELAEESSQESVNIADSGG